MVALTPAGVYKWDMKLIGAQASDSPVIAADGTVYVASHVNCSQPKPKGVPPGWCGSGQLLAITPAGQVKWGVTLSDELHCPIGCDAAAPAIAADGTVYVGSNDHTLYAVTPLCGCRTALRGLCAAARNRSSFDSSICYGAHQRQFQAANCTQGDFQAFCGWCGT